MKIRYLSSEDRQNLRILRHSSDSDEKINILESFFRRDFYTLQDLWEYRKYFLELTEKQLKAHPILVCGLIQILVIQGDLDQAYERLETLPKEGPYYLLSKIMLPGVESADMHSLSEELRARKLRSIHITVTAGRPSVLNGLWDMTPVAEEVLEDKETAMCMLSTFFGDQASFIYELICAEKLYWQDDCYEALVRVVNVIPFFTERQHMRLLFTALTLKLYILVVNGQAASGTLLVENLRQQLKHAEVEEYLPNIDALEAWVSMYDGDYAKVTRWMREAAPDEDAKFCMLDTFRYMVKMRAYIIQGKYLPVTILASRLKTLLESGKRYMDLCELHLIWAMSDYAAGRKSEALDRMEKVLELAAKYRYDRLIADEGQRALELLKLYRKERGGRNSEYLERVINLTDKSAAMHPRYLKTQLPEQPALTDTEMRVLRLLAELKTNAEIAELTGMAEETAKKHCKHIFAKLEVKNRHQAVSKAIELGVIEPKNQHVANTPRL